MRRTFGISGGERQVKLFRKDIRSALETNRTIAVKFFQEKSNLLITEIELRLKENAPISLDVTTHTGNSNNAMAHSELIVNVCWGWGKLSYSQIAYPDLTLFIYPNGNWEYHHGNQVFTSLYDWLSVSDDITQVYHNIIFDVLKLDNPV